MNNFIIVIVLFTLVCGIALFFYISAQGKKSIGLDREEFMKRWRRIEELKAQGGAGWTLSIIEADKLLDQALKASGHPGETMGDRLKGARGVFGNINDIWEAHKLRNRLAHEQDIRLNQFVVDRALGQFKAGLKDLGAL